MNTRLCILSIMAIFFLIFCFPGYAVCASSKSDRFQMYKQAWTYVENNNFEKAKELFEKNYKTEEGDYRAFWLIIKSAIYLAEEKYKEAINSIHPFKKKLKERYYYFKNNSVAKPEPEKELIEWNYKKIIIINSTANFKLGNWMEALNDYLEGTKEFNDKDYYLKAVCFYQIKNYPEALINFQYAYKTNQSKDLKDEVAYNIACLYSILNDVDHSITWLKISLSHDINKWFPKIADEKDFDNIRHIPRFIKLLEQEEQKFSQEN